MSDWSEERDDFTDGHPSPRSADAEEGAGDGDGDTFGLHFLGGVAAATAQLAMLYLGTRGAAS